MSYRCEICNTSFSSDHQIKEHLSSKSHLKAAKSDHQQRCTVFVTGFHVETSEKMLFNYFSHYGQVRKLKLCPPKRDNQRPFAFVTFEREDTVQTVLNSVHFLDQIRLKVSKKHYMAPNTNEKREAQIHEAICQHLHSSSSITEGMDKLCNTQKLTETDIKIRLTLSKTVQDILRPYYPKCEVYIYGSTMNGFGLKGCDVDLLFMPTKDYCNLDISIESDLSMVPDPCDVSKGKVSTNQLSLLDENSHLTFIAQVFRNHSYMFARPVLIPAKCPIINFIYKKHQLLCDLSCSNRLVVCNTELLKFYGNFDERVKPLIMTLRYWGKFHGFVKMGEFSSYAFTLLVIFFLQNVEPPILPSVEHLRSASDYSEIVAGWECGFSRNCPFESSHNSQSLDELLWNFFKYYLQFDFVQNIISPASGSVIRVDQLQKLDDPRMSDLKVSSICIQDPFELSRNVSKSVKHKTVIALKKYFYTIISFRNNMQNDGNALLFLFDPITHEVKRAEQDAETVSCFIDYTYLHHSSFSKICHKKDEIEEVWCEQASHAVFEVLQEGLLIYCEVVDKVRRKLETTNSTIRPEAQNESKVLVKNSLTSDTLSYSKETDSFESETELQLSIQCGIYFRTWVGRNAVTKHLLSENESSTLDIENEISYLLLERDPRLKNTDVQFWFMCDCYKYRNLGISDLLVLFTPMSPCKEFSSMTSFLKSFLPKTVEKVLSEQNQSS